MKGRIPMNWNRIEGQWKQLRGKEAHRWGRIMNDDLAALAGRREQLVGTLQEKYGIVQEESKRHVKELKKLIEELKKSNTKLKKNQKPSPHPKITKASPKK
jgi:uncharacterized protein YjbJ (UPF0337 family)